MALPGHAEFIRGPYDGLIIDVDAVERFVAEDSVYESFDKRLFLMMPSLGDWRRIVEGKADREGPFERLHPYEVSVTPGMVKLVYCHLSRFRQAIADCEVSGGSIGEDG